jgi:hypothetical protein
MEKFKHEERLLELVTTKYGEMYSTTTLNEGHGLNTMSLLGKPKFEPYFLDGIEGVSGIFYLDSIFLFDDDIYIYLSKSEPMISSFSCKIYYPIRKKKDVEFFILNLKKIKKDGN